MFKLMIADDNLHILSFLSQDTDWEEFDFTLSGAFENGKDLLDAARQDMPDLVITDISMPQMDGITLSSELYRLKPNIKIVFISSYSEFEYAKSALKLHIFDYILKPIEYDQLRDIMERVFETLHREQMDLLEQQSAISRQDYFRHAALSHYAFRLLFQAKDEFHARTELGKLGLNMDPGISLYVVSFSLSDSLTPENRNQSPDSFQSILESALEEVQIVQATLEDRFGVFIIFAPENVPPIADLLSKICVDIETRMNLRITMGYSSPSLNLTNLPTLYKQSQTALHNLLESGPTIPIASYTDMYISAVSDPSGSRTVSDHVAAMRMYIEKNYMNPITTNDVAGSVYLSPNYANRCFIAEHNLTIFGYIIQFRLEKAKELLRNTEEHVTRIAELVGYSSKASFYLAFKRATGISPTEYRELHSQYTT